MSKSPSIRRIRPLPGLTLSPNRKRARLRKVFHRTARMQREGLRDGSRPGRYSVTKSRSSAGGADDAGALALHDGNNPGEVEEFLRILRLAIDQHFVMHMRAGCTACAAKEADLSVSGHLLPD